jgi:hypothetical protein
MNGPRPLLIYVSRLKFHLESHPHAHEQECSFPSVCALNRAVMTKAIGQSRVCFRRDKPVPLRPVVRDTLSNMFVGV